MIVCVGIPSSFQFFSAVAKEMDAPTLVSANALRAKTGFRTNLADLFGGARPRLDSAGFVAMKKYGGYPWSREEYIALAGAYPWEWWASRDYCCEPEIAADRAEIVRRVELTAQEYLACVEEARRQKVSAPMPVLQGREPEDYIRCAGLHGDLPSLVGVGSMCRRPVKELVKVVDRLHIALPRHVRLHLFGVKSAGIKALVAHPRVESTDSMAWDYRAAKVAMRRRRLEPGFVCSLNFRAEYMRDWYRKQNEIIMDAILS